MLEKKKPILIVSAILIVLVLAIAFIFLQNDRSKDRGTLTGTVTDASDDSHLQGVDVSAIDQDGVHYTSREYTAVSDTDGNFRLELPPNEYTLVLEADGYQPFKSSDTYTVESGEKLEVKETFQLVSASSSDPEVLAYEGSTAKAVLGALKIGVFFIVALGFMGAVREVFGAGSIAGFEIKFFADYSIPLLQKAPGGFIVFSFVAAVISKCFATPDSCTCSYTTAAVGMGCSDKEGM